MVAVIGPTASGKSHLALRLAERFGGEIVNFDSMQVYRGLNVGTAKTPETERRGIPHHLIDILDPWELFDAGRFTGLARTAVEGISARARLPVLVGGTGFYLRSLLEGLAPGPVRDEAVRARFTAMEERKEGRLHRLLQRLDPATAARIHPRDRQKLARAAEICVLARRPASLVFAGGSVGLKGFQVLKIRLAPEREALRARIRERTRAIFAAGLVGEVRALLAGGLAPGAKALESIGYKEACAVVAGRLSPAEAEELTFYATCQYAKRQTTWFRRESGAEVIEGFGWEPVAVAQAEGRVADFLESLHG
jgi:tRNA dimethylallyltransferase